MKTVIEMVRAAGFPKWDDHEPVTVDMYARFAELVRADEREALIEITQSLLRDDPFDETASVIQLAIRDRSNT